MIKKYQALGKLILIITPRVALKNETIKLLKDDGVEFSDYQLITDKGITQDYVICQFESLHRIARAFDIIILDESEAIFEQVASPLSKRKNQWFTKWRIC